jgi:hypothetical protein
VAIESELVPMRAPGVELDQISDAELMLQTAI